MNRRRRLIFIVVVIVEQPRRTRFRRRIRVVFILHRMNEHRGRGLVEVVVVHGVWRLCRDRRRWSFGGGRLDGSRGGARNRLRWCHGCGANWHHGAWHAQNGFLGGIDSAPGCRVSRLCRRRPRSRYCACGAGSALSRTWLSAWGLVGGNRTHRYQYPTLFISDSKCKLFELGSGSTDGFWFSPFFRKRFRLALTQARLKLPEIFLP